VYWAPKRLYRNKELGGTLGGRENDKNTLKRRPERTRKTGRCERHAQAGDESRGVVRGGGRYWRGRVDGGFVEKKEVNPGDCREKRRSASVVKGRIGPCRVEGGKDGETSEV